MYPRLKSWAFPRRGFRPTTRHLAGGLHAQRSAGANCSVPSSVLSPGFIRRGVGVWRRTFAAARCRGDRLAHTALILGGLERGRFAGGYSRLGATAASAPSFDTSPGRSARGRITAAPAPAPFWLRCSTMTDARLRPKRIAWKPMPGQSAVAGSASDALPPTTEVVGFRAAQL